MKKNSSKPAISDVVSGEELRQWYWTKLELQLRAKQMGVSTTGAKFDILERIANTLDGKNATKSVSASNTSKFDWAKENISDDTVITDSYRNSQRVRAYMQTKIPHFKFNIDFMDWMKTNIGKSMSEAVEFYADLDQKMKSGRYVPEIKRHNQYNQYLRDFFVANPTLSMDQAKLYWKYKTAQPSINGTHVYEISDLHILKQDIL